MSARVCGVPGKTTEPGGWKAAGSVAFPVRLPERGRALAVALRRARGASTVREGGTDMLGVSVGGWEPVVWARAPGAKVMAGEGWGAPASQLSVPERMKVPVRSFWRV